MPIFFLLFLIGDLISLRVKLLPSCEFLIASLLICMPVIFLKVRVLKYLAMVGLGFSWALFRANFITSWSLPVAIEGQAVIIEGYISSIPTFQQHGRSFIFQATKIQGKKAQPKLRLSISNCPYLLVVGESWRFKAKLKRPHALMNPGSFDIEKSYFHKQVRTTGVILNDKINTHLPSSVWHCPIQRIRFYLLQKIVRELKSDPYLGILIALTIGLTHLISHTQWQIFRETGTNHLVAISGLHIGLVSALISKISMQVWGRLPKGPLLLPTIYVGAIVGLIMAFVYSIIAGLSPSTQRSLMMICFFVIALLLQRRVSTFKSLMLALGFIVVIDPFVILSYGFWLSFVAVFLLIYGLNGRVFQKGIWWKWGRAQWVVTLGMLPTLLFFYQQASFLAIPANIIAIPWVSFLVVPVCLLGLICSFFSERVGCLLLQTSLYLLKVIYLFLERLSHYSGAILSDSLQNNMSVFLTHLAAYLSLTPKGLVPSLLAVTCWLPYLVPTVTLPHDAMQLVVFDVGQGLATLIRTQNHVVIFDTGAKIREDFDMGQAVIVPYLVKIKARHIDVLTVSHGDNDHIGGAASIIKLLDVKKVITSVPERFASLVSKRKKDLAASSTPNYMQEKSAAIAVERCVENKSWEWDGVTFKFLSPFEGATFKGNNSSCVLKISQGKQSILMTGDIEKKAEEALLKRHLKDLPSTILIVPHHGSKTSSTSNFLKNVHPAYAICSCGYQNAYRHPHQEVINRYKKLKIKLFNTVNSGAITMTLLKDSDIVTVEEYRQKQLRIWHQ